MDLAMTNIKDKGTSMKMHPQKFAIWLFMISVVMLFAAFTSAYVVKQSDGNWLDFDLPTMFVYTTIIVVLSSFSMQLAYFSAKRNYIKLVRLSLVLTFILGVSFLIGQFYAWVELVDQSVHWTGNAAGSFIYVFTGIHGLHLVSAIIFLFIVLKLAFQFKVHSKSMLRIEMCATYWHFLGGLWLYLYLFLTLNH